MDELKYLLRTYPLKAAYTAGCCLLDFCHREVREARRGDPAGWLRRFAPRHDNPNINTRWYEGSDEMPSSNAQIINHRGDGIAPLRLSISAIEPKSRNQPMNVPCFLPRADGNK